MKITKIKTNWRKGGRLNKSKKVPILNSMFHNLNRPEQKNTNTSSWVSLTDGDRRLQISKRREIFHHLEILPFETIKMKWIYVLFLAVLSSFPSGQLICIRLLYLLVHLLSFPIPLLYVSWPVPSIFVSHLHPSLFWQSSFTFFRIFFTHASSPSLLVHIFSPLFPYLM